MLEKLARERTELSGAAVDHLQQLVADWTLVADLGFCDLVLWLPTWNGTGFIAVAQARPTTGSTALPEDAVGTFAPKGTARAVELALASGEVTAGKDQQPDGIPVRMDGSPIAVIARHAPLRLPDSGVLTTTYLEAADQLAQMIAAGDFPPPGSTGPLGAVDASPRVGDGMLRLSAEGVVEFASPNARSAFHRLGLATELTGTQLTQTLRRLLVQPGPVDSALHLIASGRQPGSAEVADNGASVTIRSIPLRTRAQHRGALVLVRDVTELRHRERALMTKDATIREIHHRVKNNLQTVAALLRMQARRLPDASAREALEESVRRVGAIAVVHEALALAPGEQVAFDQIADQVITLMADLAGQARVRRSGEFGLLDSDRAVPLAMAITELLSNAIEHGVVSGGAAGEVVLVANRQGRRLQVGVVDNGAGLPADFDPNASGRLGLQIVRSLVVDELSGSLTFEPNPGGGTHVGIDLLL